MNSIRNIIIGVVATLLVCLAGFALAYFLFISPNMTSLTGQVELLQTSINANMRTVYMASHDLKAGDVLRAEDLLQDTRLVSEGITFIDTGDIDKILNVDIASGELIVKRDVSSPEEVSTGQIVEYSCFNIPSVVKKNGFIDIRIRYQNGEDYVVLAKKQVKLLDLKSQTCFINVEEEEMQIMASAIADTVTFNATMYATSYPYGVLTEASVQNYIISNYNGALTTTYNKEEIQTERLALETRLMEHQETEFNYGLDEDISNNTDIQHIDNENTNKDALNYQSGYNSEEDEYLSSEETEVTE